MSRLLLVNCPPWGVVMPPLGIAYLSVYLKSKDKQADIYDLNLELYFKADKRQQEYWHLDTINKVLPVKIAKDLYSDFKEHIRLFQEKVSGYEIIGFSANNLISTTFAGIVAQNIKEKYPEKIVILGGPGCFHSWDRKAVPKDAVDFFVIGEGEEVLVRLLDVYEQGKNLFDKDVKIPGLLAGDREKKINFYPASCVKDIDSLPSPDFKEFDLDKYNYQKNYRPLPMLMSRGCINRCSYCIDWYMCSNFRVRSPEKVVADIRKYVELYKTTHIEFNDLLCNGNLTALEKFCDLMISSGLDIRWISYAAIRKNMPEKLLEKIKKSGCNSLCYGIESGSNRVLSRMNKHYTREDAAGLIKRTHLAGIEVRMNIIVGFPGETEDDFNQTLEFVKENKQYIKQVTNVSSFVLMPGSDLAIYPHRYGITYRDETDPGSWTDSLGLTQEIRNERVMRTCKLLQDLKITNLIVNYQEKHSKDNCYSEIAKVKSDDQAQQQSKQSIKTKLRCCKPKNFRQKVILEGLFVFSLIIDLYLLAKKKLRGSIIFPGS
jgi:radical SAM superfamily enzyme YgiQ (UPF0313 family)